MTRGFTLVELLLAIAITAMVATLIYGGYAQTALNKTRVEQDLDHQRIIQLALDKMAADLSMAFVSTHVNPSLALQSMRTTFVGEDHGREDRVNFTSFSHRRLYRNAQESDQNELSYFVTNHPDEPGVRVLARREQNRIDDDPERGGKVQILVENVEAFELEYFDPLISEWVKSWDAVEPIGQPNRLPMQVKILLTVPDPRDPNRSQTYGTRATLPMNYALNHASFTQ